MQASQGDILADNDLGPLADRLQDEARPALDAIWGQIEAMMSQANSLEEFRAMLVSGFDDLDATDLAQIMAHAFSAGHAGGQLAIDEENRDA